MFRQAKIMKTIAVTYMDNCYTCKSAGRKRCKFASTPVLAQPVSSYQAMLSLCRQMPSQQQSQSAAGSSTAASKSTEPFINLTDTYNSSMTAIGEAGRAFQDRLSARACVKKSTTQEWANPEAQR